uniref:Kinesin-like protein n=1 Tax=Ciona savignyi TaxID=51511 RepID=H2Z1R5_CIOSA
TMGSAHCVSQTQVTDDTSGIIPRVIKDIFEGINARPDCEFLVKVGYVEIYKEDVKDLLTSSRTSQNLNIRENQDGSIQIVAKMPPHTPLHASKNPLSNPPGLTEVMVSSPEETLEYMEKGNCARSVASTAMNATSSRSHAIFTIILESRSLNDPFQLLLTPYKLHYSFGRDESTCSKFHLVDLAGSERAKRTKAKGDRLQEGIKINAGLLALGNVINALGEDHPHIPYRVSKLTRLLQDSLGGNSLTVMIACASPADSNVEETLNTLRYADRARKIKNKAIVNRDPQKAEMATLRKEVQQLRLKLLQTQGTTSCVEVTKHSPELQTRVNKLEVEKEELVKEMHKLLDSNAEMCEKVSEDINTIREETLSNGTQETICDQTADGKVESESDKTLKSEHILRTAKMANQLQDLNKALAMKELAKRMCSSEENIGAIKHEYESRLAKLDSDITELQAERDGLMAALEAAKKSKENHKLSEQRRIRLLDLENQIKTLKNEKKEKEKVKKLKAQGDEKITRLNSEIHAIKTSRVKLMKQIKEESSKYQQWKKEKEREVKQLKEKDRKRQYEIVRLERDYTKQKNVLRRKTEEAAASNRRLKEALGRQQSAAAKRQ